MIDNHKSASDDRPFFDRDKPWPIRVLRQVIGQLQELLATIRHTSARSSVLANLNIIIPCLLLAFVASLPMGQLWASALLGSLVGLSVVTYLTTHVYLSKVDRDSLRSERWGFVKELMNRQLLGDDKQGFARIAEGFDAAVSEPARLLGPDQKADKHE